MILKERIKLHFNSKGYDFKFDWGKDKEKWGAKYETISSLAREFGCPKTSLYMPVKELVKEGFVTFDKIIYREEKLNSEPSVQECDASKAK